LPANRGREVDVNLLSVLTLLVLLLLTLGVAPSAEPEGKLVARTVHYSGRVQGVGFRATTARIARGFLVTGWVKNLTDGRVQLLVEGQEKEVARFLDAVRGHWKGYIEAEKVEEAKPTGKYRGFAVLL
jgi:acylphosphatase